MKYLWCGALAVISVVGCAGETPPIAWDQLRPTRHDPRSEPREFEAHDGVIVAPPPPSVTPGKPAETLGLVKDFEAQDLCMEGQVTWAPGATAGFLFRVREVNDRAVSMYALVIHDGGVNLWRLNSRGWIALDRHVLSLASNEPHVLRAEVKGDKIAVAFDGAPLFEGRDTSLLQPGGAGLYARDGACKFEAVTLKRLDRGKGKAAKKSDEGETPTTPEAATSDDQPQTPSNEDAREKEAK